jgi:hypothetical protein
MRRALLFLAIAGCVAEAPPETDPIELALVGGASTNTPELQAVVSLSGGCTGFFVHPYWIATAAHCLPECMGSTWGCRDSGGNTDNVTWGVRFIGYDGPIAWTAFGGDQAFTDPAYPIDYVRFPVSADFDPDVAPPDVALLHTSEPYRGTLLPVAPADLLIHPDHMEDDWWDGQCFKQVGFSGNGGALQRRRAGWFYPTGALVHHDRAYWLGSDDSWTCRGDSGGPTLIRDRQYRWRAMGVNSGRVDYPVGTPCVQGDPFSAFIPRPMLERVIGQGDPLCNGRSYDECVAAMTAAVAPEKPRDARIRRTFDGIRLTWADDYPPGTTTVRLRRYPSDGLDPAWPANATPGTFLDPWSATTSKQLVYRYELCAENTLGEVRCAVLETEPTPAPRPAFNVDIQAPLTSVVGSFDAHLAPGMLGYVWLYRDNLDDAAGRAMIDVWGLWSDPMRLGNHVDFTDSPGAYQRWRYDVCTMNEVGDEACESRTVDTFGGTPQCPRGTILCGGACLPPYRCDYWE